MWEEAARDHFGNCSPSPPPVLRGKVRVGVSARRASFARTPSPALPRSTGVREKRRPPHLSRTGAEASSTADRMLTDRSLDAQLLVQAGRLLLEYNESSGV